MKTIDTKIDKKCNQTLNEDLKQVILSEASVYLKHSNNVRKCRIFHISIVPLQKQEEVWKTLDSLSFLPVASKQILSPLKMPGLIFQKILCFAAIIITSQIRSRFQISATSIELFRCINPGGHSNGKREYQARPSHIFQVWK